MAWLDARAHRIVFAAFALAIIAVTVNTVLGFALRYLVVGENPHEHSHVRPPASPVPYTAVVRETVTARDGTKRVASTLTTAATASGWLIQMLGEEGRGSRIIHTADGLVVQTKDDLKLRSTTARLDDFGHYHRTPASNCMRNLYGEPMMGDKEEFVRSELRDGHPAARIRFDSVTRWFALDAGCALIGSFMDFGQGQTSEKRLVSLAVGDPSPALVHLTDFVEGPPSRQSSTKPDSRCQGDCTERLKQHFARMDAHYHANRPKR